MEKRLRLYELLVNRIPGIRERYLLKREKNSKGARVLAWLYLLWLNFSYYVLRNRNLEMPSRYPYYEEKLLYDKGAESSLSLMKEADEFAAELSAYDVVSFDVFDTLIMRPVSEPEDLFYILADRLSYPDFKNIRTKAEESARKIKFAAEGHREIKLEEIYSIIEDETGLSEFHGRSLAEAEAELECELAIANPRMLRVVKNLKKAGVHIVVTSDMYLRREHIARILKQAGFGSFDAYYISCEFGRSKNEGSLYDLVRSFETERALNADERELAFAHVGDNGLSDIERAKEHGFAAFRCVNVNKAGNKYRPFDMSSITGSFYRGLVNSHLHSALCAFSREYEYGYVYGGLFVSGYVKFIHEYVKSHSIEKVLFLSRDGDILQKVYREFYPEEKNTQYVYFSRLAAAKLTAGRFKSDFFRRFVFHKVNRKISLWQIFASMDLSFLLGPFCDEYVKETDGASQRLYSPDDFLTDKNAMDVRDFVNRNWDEVLKSYEGQLSAAGAYFSEVLLGVHSAAVVDIGWAGSGAIAIDYLVNEVWKLNCQVTGIVAGTNTLTNSEPDFSETFLQRGKLVSYLYSERENRDIWKRHDAGKMHNLYMEILLDSPQGSLKGFYPDEKGSYRLEFKKNSNDKEKVLDIQRGILDFAKQWKALEQKTPLARYISGRDAYAPLILIESSKNKGFMKEIAPMMDEDGI